jgi:hypothetical protein
MTPAARNDTAVRNRAAHPIARCAASPHTWELSSGRPRLRLAGTLLGAVESREGGEELNERERERLTGLGKLQ